MEQGRPLILVQVRPPFLGNTIPRVRSGWFKRIWTVPEPIARRASVSLDINALDNPVRSCRQSSEWRRLTVAPKASMPRCHAPVPFRANHLGATCKSMLLVDELGFAAPCAGRALLVEIKPPCATFLAVQTACRD